MRKTASVVAYLIGMAIAAITVFFSIRFVTVHTVTNYFAYVLFGGIALFFAVDFMFFGYQLWNCLRLSGTRIVSVPSRLRMAASRQPSALQRRA